MFKQWYWLSFHCCIRKPDKKQLHWEWGLFGLAFWRGAVYRGRKAWRLDTEAARDSNKRVTGLKPQDLPGVTYFLQQDPTKDPTAPQNSTPSWCSNSLQGTFNIQTTKKQCFQRAFISMCNHHKNIKELLTSFYLGASDYRDNAEFPLQNNWCVFCFHS